MTHKTHARPEFTNQHATRRYFYIFFPAIIIFLAASFSLVWAEDNLGLTSPTLIILSIIPIAALISLFWAHWRFMREIDEFLRSIQINALLFGLATILTIATGWGYLEQYADVSRLPVFWLNPMFWMAYALAAGIMTKRSGGDI